VAAEPLFETRHLSDDEIEMIVSGSMTDDRVHLFERSLNILSHSSYSTITLDLSQVTEISSLFVGHVVQSQKKLAAENRTIRIFGYPEPIGELLFMMGIDKLIDIRQKER
jgi:anti-anti-sigma regulatory factor